MEERGSRNGGVTCVAYVVLPFYFVVVFAENLLDVFCAIREDEAEHCKTMRACQTPSAISAPLRAANLSPSPQPTGEREGIRAQSANEIENASE